MMRGKICGTGAYLPEQYYDNHVLEKIVATDDAWIRERTGIVKRHIAENDTTVSMAVKAARAALENAGISPQALDLIVVSTLTPNHLIPCTACEVQKELGAWNAFGFDLNGACCGFLFGYQTAQNYIAAGMCKTVLVIGSETLSAINNWEDRGSCILFGDGAGAVVLVAEEGEIFPCIAHSDGGQGEVLFCESRTQRKWLEKEAEKSTYIAMNGQAVFKFAVKRVPEVVVELLNGMHLTVNDMDWFVLHQANARMIESITHRIGADSRKVPLNIDKYGNTSSASIPILLDEMHRDGRLKRGQKMVMAGFGAGLSWGASYLEW